jgi:cysteine desulfurase/selenocysteine lyase
MSMPDPRHAAASARVTTPPAPQWGGEAPSVIDPGLIARLGNAFLNASPGLTIDPKALANFAATQERPPAPPSSVPGAIGAAAAAPGTSVPGVLISPSVTELAGRQTPLGGDPTIVRDNGGRHIPVGLLGNGVTGVPAGAAGAAVPASGAPSPEKGQESPGSFLGEAELRALPQSLSQLTSLISATSPSGFSPTGFSHGSIPAHGPEALYFLGQTGAAAPPAMLSPSASALPGAGVPSPLFDPGQSSQSLFSGGLAASGDPAPPFEQRPAFAPNYPSEADLRPQAPGGVTTFPLNPFPLGFSHSAVPATPAIPGETLYFLNRPLA